MIRAGDEKDLPRIVEMAANFWQYTMYEEPFVAEDAELILRAGIEEQLMSVLEVDGVLQGFASGVKGPLLANHSISIGTELSLWVEPQARKGRNGVNLIKHLEDLAKNSGIKYWNMVYMTSYMPEQMDEFYANIGYNKSEVVYTKVL